MTELHALRVRRKPCWPGGKKSPDISPFKKQGRRRPGRRKEREEKIANGRLRERRPGGRRALTSREVPSLRDEATGGGKRRAGLH